MFGRHPSTQAFTFIPQADHWSLEQTKSRLAEVIDFAMAFLNICGL